MATIPTEYPVTTPPPSGVEGRVDKFQLSTGAWGLVQRILQPIASLKLTVALFALSIILILIGTLAQVEKNMWDVIHDYFRIPFCWVEFKLFFPKSFFPDMPTIPGGFPFPGGATLGALLALNLFAAHVIRFRVQARGTRLWGGLAAMAAGIFVTWLIIAGGHNAEGVQDQMAIISPGTLWIFLKIGLVVLFMASTIGAVMLDAKRIVERITLGVVALLLGALVAFLMIRGESAELSDPSLRILWQLIQATFAALVLLAGCILLFKKRGGIVLIHIGIGLLMFSELWVAMTAVEEQMMLKEGQTVSFVRDTRYVELAVNQPSSGEYTEYVTFPSALLKEGKTVSHESLPFDLETLAYYRNAQTVSLESAGTEFKATAGHGLGVAIQPARQAAGTGGGTDLAGGYIKVIPKDGSTPQVLMVAQAFGDGDMFPGIRKSESEAIQIGGQGYEFALRFRQTPKDYAITLNDVVRKDYEKTNMPRDYSSYIDLATADGGVVLENTHIWMNNPLRYGGETFYQQDYSRDRFGEFSTLAVVTNLGWMIPYVACMIVLVGMVVQFGATLLRFLNRYYRQEIGQADLGDGLLVSPSPNRKRKKQPEQQKSRAPVIVPAITVGLAALFLLAVAMPRSAKDDKFDFAKFGKIPAQYEGRVKPVGTIARNALTAMSNRQGLTYKPNKDEKYRISAEQWLLDLATHSDRVDQYDMFRIENLDVLKIFGLDRKKGFKYSVSELRPKFAEFQTALNEARVVYERDQSQLTLVQKKVMELSRRLNEFQRVQASFEPIPFPAMPSAADFESDPKAKEVIEQLGKMFREMPQLNAQLNSMNPPSVVPMELDGEEKLVPYAIAVNITYPRMLLQNATPNPLLVKFQEILDSYAKDQPQAFNRHVDEYLEMIADNTPTVLAGSLRKVDWESYFNRVQPFTITLVFYIFAFAITCVSWLVGRNVLNRTAFWLLLFAFVVHTVALIARMYISGRPPVTNLYSSAIFIAWGGVGLALIIEALYRIGIGNLAASVCGFTSLLIAGYLAKAGDTIGVLQAVLDTQFWLTTHVVCVTTGYLATLLAGIIGIVYVLTGIAPNAYFKSTSKDMGRMIYGVICFAAFFSLVGTVLGGLWADDSWGRFWGWDPKENGALIIVLWNALILHARWGGMVRERGLAILSVVGNICTTWSWFGVNELGIGLHSYGFTEGVVLTLFVVWLVHLVIVAIGLVPVFAKRTPSSPQLAA